MDKQFNEKDWVPVTSFMFLQDASVIESILIGEDIPTKVAEPNPARYSGLAPNLKTGQVLVPKPFLDKAIAILKAKKKESES